jgi:hypothetical protein
LRRRLLREKRTTLCEKRVLARRATARDDVAEFQIGISQRFVACSAGFEERLKSMTSKSAAPARFCSEM